MKRLVGYLRLQFEDKNSQAPLVPPTEFLIFPKGQHTSEKGDFLFDDKASKSVMEAYGRRGHDVQIDYEHDSLLPASEKPTDGPVPAAGWFKPEVRNGELWATEVRWTPRMLKMLGDREYRFYSPAFLYDKQTRRILELLSVGATNDPAQHHQTPLIAAKNDGPQPEEEPQIMETLLAALKLSKSATEAEALAALQSVLQKSTDAAIQLAELVAATGKATTAEAVGVIKAWRSNAKTGKAVKEELAKLKKEKRAALVDRIVARGLKERKITPAKKDEFIKIGMQRHGVKTLKAFLTAASPVVGTKEHKEKGRGGGDTSTLTETEKAMCKMTGVSEADFAKHKARGVVERVLA